MTGQDVSDTQAPAPFICVHTLRKRSDFLLAAKAARAGRPSLLVQARDRRDGDADIRIGYTCSKKIGNAVMRNRAKRRLREIARIALPEHGKPGWDYVLVGRPNATISQPFGDLQVDLISALSRIHR